MYGKIASAAIFGLSAVVQARPAPNVTPAASDIVKSAAAPMTETTTTTFPTMNPTAVQSAGMTGAYGTGTGAYPTGTGSASSGGVFKFPLSNGFPDNSNIAQIDKAAHGDIAGSPPPGLHPNTVQAVAFVAFNELFEVSFFSTLLDKVIRGDKGFAESDLLGQDRSTVIANLKVIVAQEELHELNANGIIQANGLPRLEPCTYNFGQASFSDAIKTASLFTDVVLGTLPDVQTIAAVDGDFPVVGAIGSALGNEGEQNGFYRSILGKVPSQLPFLTGGARNFAYNAILQNFVHECPVATTALLEAPKNGGIPLNETGTLIAPSGLTDENTVATFQLKTLDQSTTQSYYEAHKDTTLSKGFVTYINGNNKPFSVKINHSGFIGSSIDIKAEFPGLDNDLQGLTIAAITSTNFTGSGATIEEVAADTLFGPGLIDIN